MSDHEFLFAVHLCENHRFDRMLRELTGRVLGLVGCSASATAELSGRLLAGLAEGGAAGIACDVQFRARGGEIEIIVSAGGRRIFYASRRLP